MRYKKNKIIALISLIFILLSVSPGEAIILLPRSFTHTQNNSLNLLPPIKTLQDPVLAIAVSPDERYITIAGSNGIELWDLQQRDKVRDLAEDLGHTTSLRFSPDGRVLAVSNNKEIWILNKYI